ncbi:MAG: hypothetical protein M1549_04340 [Candidatus Dependentiae bacterium]|nr:hypothetical protein [Candidatus Dependentiae bacterium]
MQLNARWFIVSLLCPLQIGAAATMYTAKIALIIPFDFRENGIHYTVPVQNTTTAITTQVSATNDPTGALRDASRTKLAEFFSDMPDFGTQIVHLQTTPIQGTEHTYLSLWFAPSVPQSSKSPHNLALGHITGVGDNTDTLNRIFGLDLLKTTTDALQNYVETKPPRVIGFLFAKDKNGQVLVAKDLDIEIHNLADRYESTRYSLQLRKHKGDVTSTHRRYMYDQQVGERWFKAFVKTADNHLIFPVFAWTDASVEKLTNHQFLPLEDFKSEPEKTLLAMQCSAIASRRKTAGEGRKLIPLNWPIESLTARARRYIDEHIAQIGAEKLADLANALRELAEAEA